jgi:hypothetical protein
MYPWFKTEKLLGQKWFRYSILGSVSAIGFAVLLVYSYASQKDFTYKAQHSVIVGLANCSAKCRTTAVNALGDFEGDGFYTRQDFEKQMYSVCLSACYTKAARDVGEFTREYAE